jgi:hypothetical protein
MPRKKRVQVLLAVLALCLVLSILWGGQFASGALPATLILLMVLVSFGSWLGCKLEIREQGIIRSGRLLRWGNIESYEWTWESFGWNQPDCSVLKVHVRRLLKALPPFRMLVPPERREAVDAVLSRYLSDWSMAEEQALGKPQLEVDGIFREVATALPDNWILILILGIAFLATVYLLQKTTSSIRRLLVFGPPILPWRTFSALTHNHPHSAL